MNSPLKLSTAKIVVPKKKNTSQSKLIKNKSYSSESFNVINPTLRFLTISDKFEEKALTKLQEPPKILQSHIPKSKNMNSLMANQFIRNFVYEQTHEVSAIIIQRAFRLYLTKMHYKKFINIRLRFNMKLKRLFFLNWRLAIVDKPSDQVKLYQQFKVFQSNIPWIAHGRELACFNYYYCTYQIYVSPGYSQEMIFEFLKLMFSYSSLRVFRLWKITACNRKIHRSELKFIRFTAKKSSKLSPVYRIFTVWLRYVQWKKMSRKTHFEDNTYIHLDVHEKIPTWSILERKLNQKQRTLIMIQAYLKKKLKTKVVKTLYNRSIEKHTEQLAIMDADEFRNNQLSKVCCRAWLKYLEIQQKQKQMIKECMSGWYEAAYNDARKKIQINFFKKREIEFFLHKILTKWNRMSTLYKIESVYRCLRVQRDPSLGHLFCFCFFNFEVAFQIMCWRSWLKYTRRRRAWKRFCQSVQDTDPQNEKSQIIMSELKRIARAHAAGLSTTNHELLPRGLEISPELQFLNMKQINSDIEEERLSRTFTPYNKNVEKTSDALVRSLLVVISTKQNLDVFKKKVNTVDHFERFRTLQDLQEQVLANSKIFHDNIRIKLFKDRSIIASINAHKESLKYSQEFDFFTAKNEPLSTEPFPVFDVNEGKIFVFWEYEISVKNIIRQHQMAPPRLLNSFGNEMKAAFRAFDRRLRSPYEIKLQQKKNDGLANIFNGFAKSIVDTAKLVNNMKTNSPTKSANQSTISSELKFFQFKYIKPLLMHMTDIEVCLACIKTLSVISGRTVNACPTELLPPLEVSMKRKVIRNIKSFVAETELTNISSSVLGIFNGMKLDNKLNKFVGDCAFMDCIKQDSDVAMEHRVKLWRRIKQKYPNLDLPESLPDRDISQMMSANINKVRIRSSTNLLSLPADSRDELSSVEAFAGCFALPLAIGGDNLVLLINEFEK